jgi:succinylglutamate desuccinylase
MDTERIIGEYSGPEPGPLLICFGGMHGNETAGIEALTILFELIKNEPNLNPDFRFFGHMIGIRGNLQAIKAGRRYVQKDLNRQWTQDNVNRILSTPRHQLEAEDLEIADILRLINQRVDAIQPERVIFLDLHTTTAYGGIFSVASDDPESIRLGVEMHAPVIKGLLKGISGTTLHFFSREHFHPDTIAITFESGQHEEHLSVNRAIAATINCMRSAGLVLAEDVENRHDKLLIDYSDGLPKVAEFIMRHTIEPDDNFVMRPGYKNFQEVQEGEILAQDRSGPIRAICDGRILMPLYQEQGDDGFFLIRAVSAAKAVMRS